MDLPKTSQLCNSELSVAFYEARYQSDYMDSWPADKIDKVREVVRSARLPGSGKALDFGCGTGAFTAVLADLLPEWEVYGTDVSRSAIAKARARVPNARFFLLGDPEFDGLSADFVFSHHVLEHVPDLETARDDLLKYLAPTARMLHILPCGNKGSLSYCLSMMHREGIDHRLGNRFFFEDEGHVRRLTTDQMVELFSEYGFRLVQSYYTGQRWGTIDYFTRIEPHLIDTLTDRTQAVNAASARRLQLARRGFRLIVLVRNFVQRYETKRALRQRSLRDRALLCVAWAPYRIARAVQNYVESMANSEWRRKKGDARGDQMFLMFRRT